MSTEHLTKQQARVLDYVSRGYSAKQAAHSLGVSVHTIEAHRHVIHRKLGVRNSAHAVRMGFEKGYLKTVTDVLLEAKV
jgi:DNA-binding CsgD family transcriptional regulator